MLLAIVAMFLTCNGRFIYLFLRPGKDRNTSIDIAFYFDEIVEANN